MSVESRQLCKGIGVAVIVVAAAVLLRVAIHRALGEQMPFIAFFPATVLAVLYGGLPAGLTVVWLSSLISTFWVRNSFQPHFPDRVDLHRLGMFVIVELTILWLGQRAHRARQSAAAALGEREKSEHRVVDMLDSLNEAFVLLAGDWRFLYVNRAYERMYGVTRQQLLGRTAWEFFPHSQGTETERHFRRAMEERIPVELEQLSPLLGRWIATGAFPVDGGISIYVQDIDDRKRAEHALRDSEERYRRLLETAQEGIWMIDAQSNTTYVNRAMAEMLGYAPQEMLGRPLFDFMDDAGRAEATANVARRKEGIHEKHEFRFRRKDGGDFLAYLSTNPILGEKGEYAGALAMVSDITDRRRVETERSELLVREQKARADAEAANRRKDQFLAVLSHELRTPLTPVLTRLALMKREPELTAPIRDGLEMIRRNVELEARLIEDLLDVTRLARGQVKLQLRPIDAYVKIKAAAEIYETDIAARKQTLILELNAGGHFVMVDAVRLQQVFWNLLGNAVKYTPAGGQTIIRATNIPQSIGPDMLRVQFIDNGNGIDPELMPRLFDPFEQGEQTLARRFGGLGLGLTISRNLVQIQGGTLIAESAGIDQGSVFTVDLPTVPSPVPPVELQPETPAPQASFAPQAAMQRILLVDDNEDTLSVIARLLRLNGHQVVTAESVRTALAAAADPFDLLITDIGLPDGTGWDLMKTLRSRGPVRAIALSGFSMDDDIRRSRDAGFIEHLCKPIMPDDLEEAIRRATLVK